jgi:hypothetical protein
MSSAVMERTIEQTEIHGLNAVRSAPAEPESVETKKELADLHPLVPVVIAGVLSLTAAVMFVGSILAWIALRHSGVMAP